MSPKNKKHISKMQALSSFFGAVAGVNLNKMFVKINIDYKNYNFNVAKSIFL